MEKDWHVPLSSFSVLHLTSSMRTDDDDNVVATHFQTCHFQNLKQGHGPENIPILTLALQIPTQNALPMLL